MSVYDLIILNKVNFVWLLVRLKQYFLKMFFTAKNYDLTLNVCILYK